MNEINYYTECNESLAAISGGSERQRGINKSGSSHMSLLWSNFFPIVMAHMTGRCGKSRALRVVCFLLPRARIYLSNWRMLGMDHKSWPT